MKTLAELQQALLSTGQRIAGPSRPNGCFLLPTSPVGDGSAHAEIVDGRYHYVQSERGTEYCRKVAADEDELLYWFTVDSVWTMASDEELDHRQPGVDCRRWLFARELELLARASERWASRRRQAQAAVLAEHPFDDGEENPA